ncbi:MAG: M48 family metallopeptidase [Xanthomonadales bacterium]|nr:M48 family metallopeptidase [Xanthomonadales bacterium]
MNFFEHQESARKQSRWLILVFILAVATIVVAINGVILVALGFISFDAETASVPFREVVRTEWPTLAGAGVVSVAFILLASLFKMAGLRAGGGHVARQLGGTQVDSTTGDPMKRRLYNVVEEIALASGVPVPEIYVLDQEAGINAFAAGYTPSDAAVAVTRGALEKLDRNELQGVIAHEFSHILNGDMRINIRLMGALFGILLLALIGRRILIHSSFVGRSSRSKGGGAIILIAIGLTAIGYIGLFFGRWIKAAVSRQREYLADASAVQFTRDPDSIGGALKKIAVYSESSYLDADTEEISHMLFGDGRKMNFFSTHPPLEARISRVDPGFQPEELTRLAVKLQRERASDEKRRKKQREQKEKPGGMFNAETLIDGIGSPDWERMLTAAAFAAAIPEIMGRAVHSIEWAPEVLFYLLLDRDAAVREIQLLTVAQKMGADSEGRVRALLDAAGLASAEQRLPLLELAFPTLKQRPPEFMMKVMDTTKELIEADGRTDVFEFLLARSMSMHLWESQNAHRVSMAGNKSLKSLTASATDVLVILARHGNRDTETAEAAFNQGLAELSLPSPGGLPVQSDWVSGLDAALPALDRLKPADKEKLVRAMSAVVMYDGRIDAQELELLRVVCDLIHVPLPLIRPVNAY